MCAAAEPLDLLIARSEVFGRGQQGFDALIFCIQGRVEAGEQAQSPHPIQGPVGGRGLGLFEERLLDSHSESREKGRCKNSTFWPAVV